VLATPGYQINNKLYESNNSQVYRALRGADNCPVVLKALKGADPSPERIAWFKREYEVTRNLNLPGVIYSLRMRIGVSESLEFGGKQSQDLERPAAHLCFLQKDTRRPGLLASS
jgi:serine/threonine protein kinase